MKYNIVIVIILLFDISLSRAALVYVSDKTRLEHLSPGDLCIINQEYDLKGKTILLPKNCTLVFKKDSFIKNGELIGKETVLRFEKPFIGDSVSVYGCRISGKNIIRDTDVFINVSHTQKEIQTLFNMSRGIKLDFSYGVYEGIEKVEVNNNIQADFNNSIIKLNWDRHHVGGCFFMDPFEDKSIDFFKISNLTIIGQYVGVKRQSVSNRCIQLFHASDVELNNIFIDKFYGGPSEFRNDACDLLDKTRIGTCSIAIMYYDKCIINNCSTNDVGKEIFWCVPNKNPHNITYFTNNKSTCSFKTGSASFFTLLDGRCVVKNNEVYNYNGSAFNLFCYDSEISNNKFYEGKRSVAIDLSEGTMYRARNVNIHDNECENTRGLIAAYGENLIIKNNRWTSNVAAKDNRYSIVTIRTRKKRLPDGKYIGCDNNPEQDSDSKKIVIENNICSNNYEHNGSIIHYACLYGDGISFSNNIMKGLNCPVVLFADGEDFYYNGNTIVDSPQGKYTELYIKRGKDISLINNTFCHNHSTKETDYTVQISNVEGLLVYRNNRVASSDAAYNKMKSYIPCLIDDYSKLKSAEIMVDADGMQIKTGLDSNLVKLKTNINAK